MSEIQYGDLVYIQFNQLALNQKDEKFLLCSSAFENNHLFAVKADNYSLASFMNCIFRILPCYPDLQDQYELLKSLEEDLNIIEQKRKEIKHEHKKGEEYERIERREREAIVKLKTQINNKKEQIKEQEKMLSIIHEKISSEMFGKSIQVHEEFVLQHYISKSFLKAEYSAHPLDNRLLGLSLEKNRGRYSSFQFKLGHEGQTSSAIFYESELYIMSTHTGSLMSLGAISKDMPFETFSSDSQEEEYFPKSIEARPDPLKSFADRQIVGISDIQEKSRVNMYLYCRGNDLDKYSKSKIIKNGDFIRFQQFDTYLLLHQRNGKQYLTFDEMSHHNCQTIFQLIDISQEIPFGDPIVVSNPDAEIEISSNKYFLRHLVTGSFVILSENDRIIKALNITDSLFDPKKNWVKLLRPTESSIEDKLRNGQSIHLQFNGEPKEYLLRLEKCKEISEEHNQKIASRFYEGYSEPNNLIHEIKKTKQYEISSHLRLYSDLKISKIEENELYDIHEIESYANILKRSMKLLNSVKNKDPSTKISYFNEELAKLLRISTKFFIQNLKKDFKAIHSHDIDIWEIKFEDIFADVHRQNLMRSLSIIDMINQFLFHILCDETFIIFFGAKDEKINIDLLVQCVDVFVKIVILITKDNQINRAYNSQYLKLYFGALINFAGLIKSSTLKQKDLIKDRIIMLLYEIMDGQNNKIIKIVKEFEAAIFEKLKTQEDFEIYYINILTYICKSDPVGVVNDIPMKLVKLIMQKRVNIESDLFISSSKISAEQQAGISKLKKDDTEFIDRLLPTLTLESETFVVKAILKRPFIEGSFHASLTEENYKTKYIMAVLELLNVLCKAKSTAFKLEIMRRFPVDLLIRIPNDDKVLSKVRKEVLALLKNIYFNYATIPIQKVPSKVIMFFENYGKYVRDFNEMISKKQRDIVSKEEWNFLEDQKMLTAVSSYSNSKQLLNQNLSKMIADPNKLAKEYKDDLEYQTFQLSTMRNVMASEGDIPVSILVKINENLHVILNLLTDSSEAEEKLKKREKIILFDNAENIFELMRSIDLTVVEMAVSEIIKNMTANFSKKFKRAKTDELIETSLYSINTLWRSKFRLYELAGVLGNASYEDIEIGKVKTTKEGLPIYLEKKLIGALCRTIEKGNSSSIQMIISQLKYKTEFANIILKRMKDSLFLKVTDAQEFINIVNTLLNINQIARKIDYLYEKDLYLEEPDIKFLIENLGNIITSMYNPEMENNDLELSRTKFLERLYETKNLPPDKEIPVQLSKTQIRPIIQDMMRILEFKDILAGLLDSLCKIMDKIDVALPLRYCLIIVMLYGMHNSENHKDLSSSDILTTLFAYRKMLQDICVDLIPAINLVAFDTTTKKIKKKSSSSHLTNKSLIRKLLSEEFIQYLKEASKTPESEDEISTKEIVLIESVPYILKTHSPNDVLKIIPIYEAEIRKIFNFTVKGQIKHGKNILNINTSANKKNRSIRFYLLIKECLVSILKVIPILDEKGKKKLRDSIPLHMLVELYKSHNIFYYFDLKDILLQIICGLYFDELHDTRSLIKTHQVEEFISILILDLDAYVTYEENKSKIKDFKPIMMKDECFLNLNPLLREHYDEYKDIFAHNLEEIPYKANREAKNLYFVWREYILHAVYKAFETMFVMHPETLFTNKINNMKAEYRNYFDLWFYLTKNILLSGHSNFDDAEFYDSLNKIIENKWFRLETKKLKDQDTIKEITKVIKIKSRAESFDNQQETNTELEGFLGQLMLRLKENLKIYQIRNIYSIAQELAENDASISNLIKFIKTNALTSKSSDLKFILIILRAALEIQVVTEPDVAPMIESKELNETELKKIEQIQNRFNSFDIIPSLLNLLTLSKDQDLIYEIFLLGLTLLYGGNIQVQNSFMEQLTQDPDNSIMDLLGNLLISGFEDLISLFIRNTSLTDEEILNEEKIKFLPILLKFLQSLCENHNQDFQNYLREQQYEGKPHPKSFNFIEYCTIIFDEFRKNCKKNGTEIGLKILDFLIEVIQGKEIENSYILIKRNVITSVEYILKTFDDSQEVYQHIKTKSLILLKTLIERNDKEITSSFRQYLDSKVVIESMLGSFLTYSKNTGHLPDRYSVLIEDYFMNPPFMNGMLAMTLFKYIWDKDSETKLNEILGTINMPNIDKNFIEQVAYNFCNKFVVSIEIFTNFGQNKKIPSRIYYPMLTAWDFVDPELRDNFEENVERDNPRIKIEGLMDKSSDFISKCLTDYKARQDGRSLNSNQQSYWLNFTRVVLAMLINTIHLTTLSLNHPIAEEEKLINVEGGSDYVKPYVLREDPLLPIIADWLSVANAIVSIFAVYLWVKTKAARYLANRWEEDMNMQIANYGPIPDSALLELDNSSDAYPPCAEVCILVMKSTQPFTEIWNKARRYAPNFFYKNTVRYILQNGILRWEVFYFCICIITAPYTFFASIQLIHIIKNSETVKRLWAAVSENATHFMWTLILFLTSIYYYGLIAFYFMDDVYKEEGELLCIDAFSCMFYHVNYGLRSGGGIADNLEKMQYDPDHRFSYLMRIVYDLSFFILIIILLKNMIFGMIVDTFGDLRDAKNEKDEDREDICFICGLSRDEIHRYLDFEEHREVEHNKWNYLGFIMYLREKRINSPTEMTDIESYVWEEFEKKNYEWFPIGKSLSLEIIYEREQKNKGDEFEEFKEDVSSMIYERRKNIKIMHEYIQSIKNSFTRGSSIQKRVSLRSQINQRRFISNQDDNHDDYP